MGLVFAALVVGLRVQQVIAGTALSMLGLALTASLHRAHAALVPTDSLPPVAITRVPLLADVPVLGPAFFAQPMATYLLYVVFPVISWMLYRSIAGVALRATGESPMAVVAAGHSPARIQSLAIIAGAALLLDLYDRPGDVERLLWQAHERWWRYWDRCNGVLQPAQTIFAVWINDAVLQSSGVVSFDPVTTDHVMPNAGAMAVPGTITYA